MNSLVNAVAVVLGARALEAAAGPRASGGGDLPRLHGVPFTVRGSTDPASTPAIYTDIPSKPAPTWLMMPSPARSTACGWPSLSNALGLPAVAVPVGVADGLPQVMQVIGPRYREDLCLDAAAALEEALGVY